MMLFIVDIMIEAKSKEKIKHSKLPDEKLRLTKENVLTL